MKSGLLPCCLLSLLGFVYADVANASSPTEKLLCTKAPRSEWLSEARAREIFGDKDYVLVEFKISRGNCYEFYAVHQDGSVVEAYYHPVSGNVARFNRVSAASSATRYESRTTAAPAAQR